MSYFRKYDSVSDGRVSEKEKVSYDSISERVSV